MPIGAALVGLLILYFVGKLFFFRFALVVSPITIIILASFTFSSIFRGRLAVNRSDVELEMDVAVATLILQEISTLCRLRIQRDQE